MEIHALRYKWKFYCKRLSTVLIKREVVNVLCFVVQRVPVAALWLWGIAVQSIHRQYGPGCTFPTSVLECVSRKRKLGLPSSKASSSMTTSWYIACYSLPYCFSSQDAWEIQLKHGDPVTLSPVRKDIWQKMDLGRIHYTMGLSLSLPVSSHGWNRPCFYWLWGSHLALLKINCNNLVARNPFSSMVCELVYVVVCLFIYIYIRDRLALMALNSHWFACLCLSKCWD